MATASSASLFVNTPSYIEEATEGTTPTSGTTVAIGAVKSMSIKHNGNYQDISILGSEDLITTVQGQQEYETSITFYIPDTGGQPTFMKYLVDSANFGTPTNTISASLSIVFSLPMDAVTNYIILKGTRVKDGSVKMEVGKATEVTVNMIHTSISVPSSTAPTGLTLAATPTGNVLSWTDGGTAPVSWDSTGRDCKSATININRNTKAEHTLGNLNPIYTQSHGRRASGDFTTIWTTNDLETDFGTPGSGKDFVMVLDSSVYTLTVASAKITDYTRDYDADTGEAIVEQCTFRGTTITAS